MIVVDRMQTAAARLFERLHAAAAADVTYKRGTSPGEKEVTFSAVRSTIDFAVSDSDGVPEKHTAVSFDFDPADLEFVTGGVTTPRRGDKIELTVAGQVITNTVALPGAGPCYEYASPYREQIRVFCKQTEVA